MRMDGNTSGLYEVRSRIVADLRQLGAKTIVGVYTKFNPVWLGNKNATEEDLTNKQAWRLFNNPPTAEEFDYLIVV